MNTWFLSKNNYDKLDNPKKISSREIPIPFFKYFILLNSEKCLCLNKEERINFYFLLSILLLFIVIRSLTYDVSMTTQIKFWEEWNKKREKSLLWFRREVLCGLWDRLLNCNWFSSSTVKISMTNPSFNQC